MAWIRLSDDYTEHPKFANLSDGAFRLWHQAMGFCRKYQTDGLIPMTSVKQFTAYTVKRMKELLTPWREAENPLWHLVDGFGVKVHDYLQWNPSKDEENEKRADSKERMRLIREGRKAVAVTPIVASGALSVRANNTQTTRDVLGWDGKEERTKERNVSARVSASVPMNGTTDPELAAKAGLFCERYGELYSVHRRGARYLPRPALDYTKACELCAVWDLPRLEQLAVVFLKTDHDFAASGSRTIGQFAALASWCDDRLREVEASV